MAFGFRFPHDDHWIEIDLDTEPRKWAEQAAARACTAAGRGHDQRARKVLAAQLIHLAQASRRLQPTGALILCPEIAGTPAGVVELLVAEIPDGYDLDDVGREIVLPDDVLIEPPVVDSLDSAAGPAVRAIQRRLAAAEYDPAVLEQRTYAWLAADERVMIVASITFTDLTEAARLGPMVDDLMRTCEFLDQPDDA